VGDNYRCYKYTVYRHYLVSHVVGRSVNVNVEPALERFVCQFSNLGRESTGGDGDVARADLETPGRVDDPNGANDVGEIGQRFAHPHEDDVVDPLAARFFYREQLLHDLARIKVPRKSVETARAKFTAISAADLGGNANGAAVRGRAIKRRRSGDQDRFDEVSIAEPKEKFSRRVLRAENADGF